MLAKAVAKARELVLARNVAISMTGGHLKASADGRGPDLSIEMRRIRRIQRCSVFPRRSFSNYTGDPSLLAASPARACGGVGEGFRFMWTENLSGDRG